MMVSRKNKRAVRNKSGARPSGGTRQRSFLLTTKRFERSWRKLPPWLQQQAHNKIALLVSNPAHPSLKVHTLKRRPGVRECYLTNTYRLLFCWQNQTVTLLDVGSHDCVDHAHQRRGA